MRQPVPDPSARFAFLQGPRPLLFVHRGGTERHEGNTLAAFADAAALGFRIETDLRAARDGAAVIAQDDAPATLIGDPERAPPPRASRGPETPRGGRRRDPRLLDAPPSGRGREVLDAAATPGRAQVTVSTSMTAAETRRARSAWMARPGWRAAERQTPIKARAL